MHLCGKSEKTHDKLIGCGGGGCGVRGVGVNDDLFLAGTVISSTRNRVQTHLGRLSVE